MLKLFYTTTAKPLPVAGIHFFSRYSSFRSLDGRGGYREHHRVWRWWLWYALPQTPAILYSFSRRAVELVCRSSYFARGLLRAHTHIQSSCP